MASVTAGAAETGACATGAARVRSEARSGAFAEALAIASGLGMTASDVVAAAAAGGAGGGAAVKTGDLTTVADASAVALGIGMEGAALG